ncbi:hypothetical protein RQP46_006994 [Phenoliferia psychrophenolica]
MKVFVTGASGWVGSAVVRQLIEGGHEVVGLARSDASAKAIEAAGATVLRGDLEDLETLKQGAAASDGVIHCGFNHDFSRMPEMCVVDELAIKAMGSVLIGKPLVVSSAIIPASDGTGNIILESFPASVTAAYPRKSESAVFSLTASGVRTMAVRLPPTTHGKGESHGFIPMLIRIAREKGQSGYVKTGGDRGVRWSAVHVNDAAKVYIAALIKGKAGSVYHAIGDEGILTKEIAEVIWRKLTVPVVAVPSGEEAVKAFGFMGHLLGADGFASGKHTQEELGVAPTEVGLVEDLELGHYFDV